MLKCYIEGKNLINGTPKEYKIATGAVFTENFNETLDSGTIILPQLKEEIDIEPYDVVVIYSTDDSKVKINQKRLCVDTISQEQTCIEPAIYKYSISLFSETKLLEGILLPNRAITKLMVGTPRTVYHYLLTMIMEYGPKLNSSGTQGAYGDKWSFGANIHNPSDTVASRFNAIECPEMQWNEPTLREVLTDLMMVNDCIPVLRGNKIDFIDLTETNGEITSEQKKSINYIHKTYSSQDYVSEIKMKLSNSANNSLPSGDTYYDIDSNELPNDKTIIERVGFRNNDVYLLTTNNIKVETTFPIWKLFVCNFFFKASANFKASPVGSTDPSQEISFSVIANVKVYLKNSYANFILEYGEWQTKPVFYGSITNQSSLSSDYQNTCLYYKRGSKGIFNFSAKQQWQSFFITNQVSVFELMIKDNADVYIALDQAAKDYMIAHGYDLSQWNIGVPTDINIDGGFTNCYFEIAYEPIDDCTFMASKAPFQNHKRQIVDNQTNSYIDIKRQGMLEYLKAKRLGNKVSLINGRYKENESALPYLSQAINGAIIFKKEIAVYNNYIKVNYQATENYVLRDYFTGIKSKIRSWRIADGSDVLVRAELLKFYFGSHIAPIDSTYKLQSPSNLEWFLDNLNYCSIRFNISGGTRPGNTVKYEGSTFGTNMYLVEFSKHICGNSVLFTIKMLDNAIVGKYISKLNGHDGGSEQQNAFYVDDNGEYLGGEIWFSKTFNPLNTGGANADVSQALRPAIVDTQMNNVLVKIPFTLHKDNKEITQITIQFEKNDEANDAFLGKK